MLSILRWVSIHHVLDTSSSKDWQCEFWFFYSVLLLSHFTLEIYGNIALHFCALSTVTFYELKTLLVLKFNHDFVCVCVCVQGSFKKF